MLLQTKNTNAFIKVFPNMQFSISVIIQLTRRNEKDNESRSTQYKFVFAKPQNQFVTLRLNYCTYSARSLPRNESKNLFATISYPNARIPNRGIHFTK